MDESKFRAVFSHGVMNTEHIDILIDRIVEHLGHKGIANISFQGGEPTVADIEYFRYFTDKMKQYLEIETHYSIQTNATLLNDDIVKLFKENNFQVLESIKLLEKYKVDYNILSVITRQLAKHPEELFDFYLKHNFEYVQFIPCLLSFGQDDDGMSLTPETYASFFKEFFKHWIAAYKNGISINNLFIAFLVLIILISIYNSYRFFI